MPRASRPPSRRSGGFGGRGGRRVSVPGPVPSDGGRRSADWPRAGAPGRSGGRGAGSDAACGRDGPDGRAAAAAGGKREARQPAWQGSLTRGWRSSPGEPAGRLGTSGGDELVEAADKRDDKSLVTRAWERSCSSLWTSRFTMRSTSSAACRLVLTGCVGDALGAYKHHSNGKLWAASQSRLYRKSRRNIQSRCAQDGSG